MQLKFLSVKKELLRKVLRALLNALHFIFRWSTVSSLQLGLSLQSAFSENFPHSYIKLNLVTVCLDFLNVTPYFYQVKSLNKSISKVRKSSSETRTFDKSRFYFPREVIFDRAALYNRKTREGSVKVQFLMMC